MQVLHLAVVVNHTKGSNAGGPKSLTPKSSSSTSVTVVVLRSPPLASSGSSCRLPKLPVVLPKPHASSPCLVSQTRGHPSLLQGMAQPLPASTRLVQIPERRRRCKLICQCEERFAGSFAMLAWTGQTSQNPCQVSSETWSADTRDEFCPVLKVRDANCPVS